MESATIYITCAIAMLVLLFGGLAVGQHGPRYVEVQEKYIDYGLP
jgi:hypothetical protein